LQTLLAIFGSGFATTLLTLLLNRHWANQDKKGAQKSAESMMLLGLGHDRIIYLTDKYVERGGITLKEMRNLNYLYKPYREMNGNGDCEIGYDACTKLPILSEEEALKLDIEKANSLKRRRTQTA
jgi:hypothetical protein